MKKTNNLQTAGGISALIASATYLFAIAMVMTVMAPLADPAIIHEKYMAFLTSNKTLVFIWHFAMYLVNGVCLVILSLALHERVKRSAPIVMKTATVLGLIWASFVLLSGFITIYGTEAIINLNKKNPAQAETLKRTIEIITLSIDHSDRFLGCLWIGLISIAAFKKGILPRALNIFGIIIGISGLIGTGIPELTAISYAFGVGAIIWWICIGIWMLRKKAVRVNTVILPPQG